MHILIATPSYGQTVTLGYVTSVRDLEKVLNKHGVLTGLAFNSGSWLPFQRNVFASIVLNSERFTHLLFIDADMSFQPSAVVKLVQSGALFSGCICPAKSQDLLQTHKIAKLVDDPIVSHHISQRYVAPGLKVDEDGRYGIIKGFVEADSIGCGIILIHRSVFETMRDKIPEIVLKEGVDQNYSRAGLSGDVLQAFDPIRKPNGTMMAEDVSFSYRWVTQCNGRIWACVDETIGHTGDHTFTGRALDQLEWVNKTAQRS